MLKRLVLFVALLFLLNLYAPKSLAFSHTDGTYTFYLNQASSNAQIVNVDCKNAKTTIKNLVNVCGESVCTTEKGFIEREVERFCAKKVFSETLDGRVAVYYYTESIANYKIINGKKVNLQTVDCGNVFFIGTPLIFGSF